MRWPIDPPHNITTEFGVPDSYAKFGRHSGLDMAVALNRPVFAPASGNLTNIVSPTGGNMVVIYDGKYYHRLMHNNAFVRGNGSVTEGERVALAGSTGLSTGVHIHYDVNTESTYPTSFNSFVNPNDIIKQGDDMQPATYEVANIYAQTILFRDMGRDEWEKYHKNKTRDQLFDDFRSASERAENLKKLIQSDNEQLSEESLKLKNALREFLD